MTGVSVRTRGLGVSYGDTRALHGVDLDLGGHRIHGLLGRNGAGKTTLLSVIASLQRAGEGRVEVDGVDPFERAASMEQVCLIRESGDVLGDQRVSTNLDVVQSARPNFDRDYAEALLDAFEVPLRSRPGRLSRGQRSALGAVIGLASRAPVTMFDEVHLGMDAPTRQRFYDELLAEFAARPRTVVISSHLIHEVEPLLETVTVLHRGRLLLSAEADEVRRRGVTLTGRSDLVDRLTQEREVIGRRDLGPTREAVVYGDQPDAWLDEARDLGVQLGAVPLQDLVIHLTDDRPRRPAPTSADDLHPRPLARKDAS